MGRKTYLKTVKDELVEDTFEINQIVFAKVSGYSPWPALIIDKVGKNAYRLIYYGTNENGVVGQNFLSSYNDETKALFVNEKTKKRKWFQEAVAEADRDLAGLHEEEELPEDIEFESEEVATFRTSKIHLLNNHYKMNELRLQEKMIRTVENIQVCLSAHSKMYFADALTYLNFFQLLILPRVTRLMIFKWPKVGQTFICLRAFCPQTYEEHDATRIENIKSIAKEICESFKVIYGQTNELNFQIVLDEREARLAPKLKSLSKEDLFEALSMDELEASIEATTAD